MAPSIFSGVVPSAADSIFGFSSTLELTVLAMTYPHIANTSTPAPYMEPVNVDEKNFPNINMLRRFVGIADIGFFSA
jgi:hypothetical protein